MCFKTETLCWINSVCLTRPYSRPFRFTRAMALTLASPPTELFTRAIDHPRKQLYLAPILMTRFASKPIAYTYLFIYNFFNVSKLIQYTKWLINANSISRRISIFLSFSHQLNIYLFFFIYNFLNVAKLIQIYAS